MRTLTLLICLLPGLASAGSLYRCVSQTGHVSYQSANCPNGQRTDRTIEFVPDPAMAASKVVTASKRLASKHRSEPRQGSGRIGKPQPSPCARARAKREAQLQRLGLRRNFVDLSRIDAAVRAVCNGY